jgi:hypothetical protein
MSGVRSGEVVRNSGTSMLVFDPQKQRRRRRSNSERTRHRLMRSQSTASRSAKSSSTPDARPTAQTTPLALSQRHSRGAAAVYDGPMLDNVEWRGVLVILSPFLGLAGVWLGNWLERRHVRDTAAKLRRENAAALLAPIKATIMDADPQRFISDADKRLTDQIPQLGEAGKRGREALLTLSIGHPSEKVRSLSQETAAALGAAITETSFFVLRQAQPDLGGELNHHDARSRQAEAMKLIDELAEAVRNS